MKTSRLAAALAGLALLAGLAGCSGPSPTPSPTGPTPSETIKASPLPSQPNLGPTPAGVAKDVTITECPTDPGEAVVAKGTVKNSATQTRDISITVIWLRNDSGSPLGSGLVVVRGVKPGETKGWEVKAHTVAKSDRCALHALSGSLQQQSPSPSQSNTRR